jgi:hypothetical protein
LLVAVLAVVAGAGLVLLGASRVWRVEVVARPAPLRPEELAHTGGALAPLLPALGLVALAAAGGLLATRGVARRLVGAVLGLVGVALVMIVVGALAGASPVGPAACLAGAALIVAAGGLTMRWGGGWPEMGARYGRSQPYRSDKPHRPDKPHRLGEPHRSDEPHQSDSPGGGATARVTVPGGDLSGADLWDALDQGRDPTRD